MTKDFLHKVDNSPEDSHLTKQYYQGKKKLRFLTLFILLIAITLHAEEHDYGPPVSVCLNKHTIPYINTMIPAENIVNDAYLTCQGVVDEWNRERESLPKEMVIKQNKELRDMYIRMIEIRRKASAHKK
ncbi:hypothetical protein [Enterobacter roggenkampii]|uniref:hypothetical protein n=1 Tax=Enterobacter roggenkampii TaxID=1812935 RepID=UPI00200554A6|nr:hypothetical protein [Enterobacter roggenkampii]MCK6930166.1 hypothetical protein [Enterobacter roggenkampii]MDL0014976.1 hypothetical protein [Enterobacter roggenkampii]